MTETHTRMQTQTSAQQVLVADRLEFRREHQVGERRFQVVAVSTGDERLEIRLTGAGPGGDEVLRLEGVLPPGDLPIAADLVGSVGRLFGPAQASGVAMPAERRKKKSPQAFARWTEAEELRLVARHAEGAGLPDLAQEFSRSKGAIAARLERLGVIPEGSSGYAQRWVNRGGGDPGGGGQGGGGQGEGSLGDAAQGGEG